MLQLKGSGAELSRRVQNLLMLSRLQADGLVGGSVYLPGSTKIHEQSLADMQEVQVKLLYIQFHSLYSNSNMLMDHFIEKRSDFNKLSVK